MKTRTAHSGVIMIAKRGDYVHANSGSEVIALPGSRVHAFGDVVIDAYGDADVWDAYGKAHIFHNEEVPPYLEKYLEESK